MRDGGAGSKRSTGRGENRAADWRAYYVGTRDRPPRQTILRALDLLANMPMPEARDADDRRRVVDLGCGGGRDTAPILASGFDVLAIDRAADAEGALNERFSSAMASGQLVFRQQDFAADTLQLPAAQLVNASFCLPTCPPKRFPGLWAQISQALIPGGLFAGHLYGPQDSWAERGDDLTIHTRSDIDALFENWEMALCEEEETDSVTPRGTKKHWHVFHIVARKAS